VNFPVVFTAWPARAAQLMASFELGKRIASYFSVEKPSIHTPSDVARLLMNEMRYYKKEVFKVLLLDTKNRLIKIETISSGILDASLVYIQRGILCCHTGNGLKRNTCP
jgi:DNA repair protein RadC